MGIRNMAKKRAPMTVVPAAMALPMAATSMRQMMCSDLSFVLAELNVTHIERRKVTNCCRLVGCQKSHDYSGLSFDVDEGTTYPGWSCEPQRDDSAISKRSHNSREEVLKRLGE